MFYTTSYSSPLGPVFMASDGENLVGLWLERQKYFAATVQGAGNKNASFAELVEKPDLPVFIQTKEWLDAYFAKKNPSIKGLPLAPIGGVFRKAVWDILCGIPYGQCITYGEIAKMIAAKMNKKAMSSQAVGGAVGHNPISIIIPCHRVVGAKGNLTGYAGGLDKKIWLLTLEGVDMTAYYAPKKGTAL